MDHAPDVRDEGLPTFLKIWIVVQVIGLAGGVVLNPNHYAVVASTLFWGFIAAVITYSLARHSKTAWVISILLASLSILGGLNFLMAVSAGRTSATLTSGFGLAFGVSELAILVSAQARAWVNQPTIRRWDP